MANCEFSERCGFFNGKLATMPPNVDEIKAQYCLSNNLHCARYIVSSALGPENLPGDLWPPQKDRAYPLIAAG